VFNPSARLALRLGIAPRAFALLETRGRRSGRRRLTPVGNGLDGDVFWLVSEHGTGCDQVKNLIAEPDVRVKVGRHWYRGTATVVDDDDAFARRRRIDEGNGMAGRVDGVVFRASASVPVTVRIDLRHRRSRGHVIQSSHDCRRRPSAASTIDGPPDRGHRTRTFSPPLHP
jgi:deazaflavin-dependent oxidoreductase (nitroreductase family)